MKPWRKKNKKSAAAENLYNLTIRQDDYPGYYAMLLSCEIQSVTFQKDFLSIGELVIATGPTRKGWRPNFIRPDGTMDPGRVSEGDDTFTIRVDGFRAGATFPPKFTFARLPVNWIPVQP